jgi:ribosomal protein S18 acetylase RimI-like enzyme
VSLYAEYLKERTNDSILELDFGFIIYRHLPEELTTFIVDIFVENKHRRQGFASQLADEVLKEAQAAGHKKLSCMVATSAKNSTDSAKAILGYGMHFVSSGRDSWGNDFIVFEKDING